MDGSGTLQQSLGAMGSKELALAFVAAVGYALFLNASLGWRARLQAFGIAGAAATAFVALAEPWVHGFILAVLGVAAIGIFSALVWAVSAACGFSARNAPATAPLDGATGAAPLAADAGATGPGALDGAIGAATPRRPASDGRLA